MRDASGACCPALAAARLLALLTPVLLLSGPVTAREARLERTYLCGPRCVRLCAQRLGVEAELTHLANLSAARPGRGPSLAALAQAAREFGLEARCYSLDLDDLREVTSTRPAIAHVDGNHFVVVWMAEDELTVVDPPGEPYTQTLDEFGRRWNGAAVVVSRPGAQPRWGVPYLGPGLLVAGTVLLLAAVLRLRRRSDGSP